MTTVYRIQDRKGRGPFQPGFSKYWASETFGPGMEAIPTWMEEFGWDLIDRLGKPGEHFGSAVRAASDLAKWFSDAERSRLQTMGFYGVSMKADRILAESGNQLVFARIKPLSKGAIIMHWRPELHELRPDIYGPAP